MVCTIKFQPDTGSTINEDNTRDHLSVFSLRLTLPSLARCLLLITTLSDGTTYLYVPSMMLVNEEAKDMLDDETNFNEWCEKKRAYLVAIEAVRVVPLYSASIIDCFAEARGYVRHMVGKESKCTQRRAKCDSSKETRGVSLCIEASKLNLMVISASVSLRSSRHLDGRT